MASHDPWHHPWHRTGLLPERPRPHDPDRRFTRDCDAHPFETHFHSPVEQLAILHGRPLPHDVGLERRHLVAG